MHHTCLTFTTLLCSLVTPADDLTTVLEKARRLGERVLEGKSVAVAIGDITRREQDKDEEEGCRFSHREKQLWQLWKRGYELPVMRWQSNDKGEEDHDRTQSLGKRKSKNQGSEQPSNAKKRKGRSAGTAVVDSLDLDTLGELYHLSPEARAAVTEADVHHFKGAYPELRALLTAVAKVLQARSDMRAEKARSEKLREENQVKERQATLKAIYAVEKQVQWIMNDAGNMVDAIQDQMSLMRGRLTAVKDTALDSSEEMLTTPSDSSSVGGEDESTAHSDCEGLVEQKVAGEEHNSMETPSTQEMEEEPHCQTIASEQALKTVHCDQSAQHRLQADISLQEEPEDRLIFRLEGTAPSQPEPTMQSDEVAHLEEKQAITNEATIELDPTEAQQQSKECLRTELTEHVSEETQPVMEVATEQIAANCDREHAPSMDGDIESGTPAVNEKQERLFARLGRATHYPPSDPVQATSSQNEGLTDCVRPATSQFPWLKHREEGERQAKAAPPPPFAFGTGPKSFFSFQPCTRP